MENKFNEAEKQFIPSFIHIGKQIQQSFHMQPKNPSKKNPNTPSKIQDPDSASSIKMDPFLIDSTSSIFNKKP